MEAVSPETPAEDKALVGRFTGVSFAVHDIHAEHQCLTERGVTFTQIRQFSRAMRKRYSRTAAQSLPAEILASYFERLSLLAQRDRLNPDPLCAG